MPRGKKVTAGIGHNGAPLSEEDKGDLQHWYEVKIRESLAEAATAKAVLDGKRQATNSLYAGLKSELQIDRKRFEALLEKLDMGHDEFLADQAEWNAIQARHGLPVGTQMALPLGDTADDAAAAYENGKRAGLAGKDNEAPDTVHPSLIGQWEHGWLDGQKLNIEKLGRAETIRKAREEAKKPKPPEVEVKESEFNADAEAKALKASNFMNTDVPADEEAETPETAAVH